MSSRSHVTPDKEFPSKRKERIKDELGEVLDPCSCMSDHPISILDLGLVENIDVNGDVVHVDLLLTSQLCTYFLEMSDEIAERVEGLEGIERVEVHQDTSGQIWTPDRMAENERKTRRERLRTRMEEAGIEPYAERT